MAIPPWILESPLKAGIQTMEAGGRLGLSARGEDLRQAAQQDAAAEASDRAALSIQEMQQRREEAAARLAESLRAQTALEQYRQSEVANQAALRQQAKDSAAAMLLRQGQQQQNWTADHALRVSAEKRLEDKANEAADFTPGNAEAITLPNGTVVGHRWQRSPRVWESVKEPQTELTPKQQLDAQIRLATAGPKLASMDTSSPFFPGTSNALVQAISLLSPSKPSLGAVNPAAGTANPPKEAASAEARTLIAQFPEKADAIRARYKAVYGEDL